VSKEEERKRARQLLNELNASEIAAKSKVVSKNLFTLTQQLYSTHFVSEGCLGAYAPIGKEVLWYLEFKSIDYKYAVPHMMENSQMEYHLVNLASIESLGLTLTEQMRNQPVTPKALLIPGLAFTKEGKRLGRGKGYFDRYLENYNGIKIGVCFEVQVFDDLQNDEHDVLMDYVVTEKNIYKGK
jgi:5-formyltetrahydrofolate cyclo-ligase